MSVEATGGRNDASVDTTETDLLGETTAGAGLAIPRAARWIFTVKPTTQDITVRVYKRAGPRCGFTLVSGLTTSVTAGAQAVIEGYDEAADALRITGQTASGTATVDSDFRAVGAD